MKKFVIISLYLLYILPSNVLATCLVNENIQANDYYPPYSNYTGLGELQNPFCDINDNQFTCSNIENGLKLIHNFEYSQGIFNFKIAQKFSPERAIGYALELLSLHQFTGNSIFFNKKLQENSKKLVEILKNKALMVKNEKEQRFIDAVKSFYTDEKNNYVDLKTWDILMSQNRKFETQMCNLSNKYPDEVEFIAFCGLGILRSRNGAYDLEKNQYGLKILNKGYELNQNHPGILHYLIHMVENPLQAHHARAAAEEYSTIAFNALHGVHMPAHHYFNTGDWNKIIEKTEHAWDIGQKMNKSIHNVKIGSTDNFHAMRWIVYAYLQLGRYDDAFNSIVKMIEGSKNLDDYLDGGAIFDFSQSAALTLVEGSLTEEQTRYLMTRFSEVANQNDKFSKIYLNYVHAVQAYRKSQKENFDSYIKNVNAIIEDYKTSHFMHVYNFKIMHMHLITYNHLLNNDLDKAEEAARLALNIEDEYVSRIFETGPMMAIVPSNELLGIVLMKKGEYQNAINEFLKIELRFPNRLVVKRYLEECYKMISE